MNIPPKNPDVDVESVMAVADDGDDTEERNTEEGKLVDWKNPPTIADLKQDYTDAKPAHDVQKAKIKVWLDNLNVEGKAKVKASDGNSSIQPKLIRKQAEWRYAALSEPFLSTESIFKVSPVTWEDREAAQQNALVLNNQFNTKINKVAFIDEYVRTAVDEGTVIVRLGWAFEEEEFEEEVPVVEYRPNPELGPLHEQLMELEQTSPSQYATDVPEELKVAHQMTMEQGVPIEPVVTGYEWKTSQRTVKNCPTVEICDYRNITLDPTAFGDVDKSGFMVYSFESSLAELRKDSKYKNLDKLRPSAGGILAEPDHAPAGGAHNFNFADKPRTKFIVHEYWGNWDIEGSGRVKPIVAAWAGDVLIRLEENPYPDKKFPYISVQYLPVRRSAYGEPDGALLEDNQKIMGAVTRGMIDIMGKSANGQTGIAKNLLDATNRRKFDKGMDYEFNPGIDPQAGVYMHKYPEIPNSAQLMLQMQNQEAESLTGVKSYSQGVSGNSLGDVAAGVRGALDAASKRELGILRRLSTGITAIGRKFISMNAKFLSDTEVVRITNDQFVQIRKDDLGGSFDLKLDISTAEEDNAKAQELAFMLQTMGNNMDPAMTKMILSDICRLRKMPDMAQKVEAYEPQPDPFAQEMQQLEMELLKAKIANEMAQASQYTANAQLHGAKVGTEAAKAGNLQSDTDQKNLDFVEQESGVKQERDLQKHGEQARSQAQLKLIDQDFKREEQNNDLLKEFLLARKQ